MTLPSAADLALLLFACSAYIQAQSKLISKASGKGQGAFMMLEAQTFDYVVKDQDGEILGTYSSTDEPPMKGDLIDLSSLPHWEAAEVLQ